MQWHALFPADVLSSCMLLISIIVRCTLSNQEICLSLVHCSSFIPQHWIITAKCHSWCQISRHWINNHHWIWANICRRQIREVGEIWTNKVIYLSSHFISFSVLLSPSDWSPYSHGSKVLYLHFIRFGPHGHLVSWFLLMYILSLGSS